MPKLQSIKVSLKIPYFGGIEGTWQPDETEKRAAWELYVELVTHISVVELRSDEGLLREAPSSLHSLFDTTRKILRQYGPEIARPKDKGNLSFGYLAVAILNLALRPLLAKWHPLLLDYEGKREIPYQRRSTSRSGNVIRNCVRRSKRFDPCLQIIQSCSPKSLACQL